MLYDFVSKFSAFYLDFLNYHINIVILIYITLVVERRVALCIRRWFLAW